jgi:hypothetical protein
VELCSPLLLFDLQEHGLGPLPFAFGLFLGVEDFLVIVLQALDGFGFSPGL